MIFEGTNIYFAFECKLQQQNCPINKTEHMNFSRFPNKYQLIGQCGLFKIIILTNDLAIYKIAGRENL
jgi:hypothetical protein